MKASWPGLPDPIPDRIGSLCSQHLVGDLYGLGAILSLLKKPELFVRARF